MNRRSWYRKKYEHEMILSKHRADGPFEHVMVLDNLKASFNVGKIIRSANAFGCREVHLVGIPMFDPSPAAGALKHTKSRSFPSIVESLEHLRGQGYTIYALDPHGAAQLGATVFPPKSAFIVGHEQYGFSFDLAAHPDLVRLNIPQFGTVQSLNAAVAASLACFEYVRSQGRLNEARVPPMTPNAKPHGSSDATV